MIAMSLLLGVLLTRALSILWVDLPSHKEQNPGVGDPGKVKLQRKEGTKITGQQQ